MSCWFVNCAIARSCLRGIGLACVLIAWHANHVRAQDAATCGSLENNYGPIDYRKMTEGQSRLVEGAHFTPGVENLTQQKSSYFADDISYTLRVFPNHPRALLTMQRLADREKTDKPAYAQWSMACYYERAIRFQPNDHIVRMLFATYLIKANKLDEASKQVETAANLSQESPFTQFNAGLIYLDMKNYERAVFFAHRAMAMGLTLPDLKNRLVAAGKWVEPASATEAIKP